MCDSLHYLLDNIFIRFGSKLYKQIVGIPMGTNCAPLVADLFLFGSHVCDVLMRFCYFSYGVLGQVCYLIVSILNLCILPYFVTRDISCCLFMTIFKLM